MNSVFYLQSVRRVKDVARKVYYLRHWIRRERLATWRVQLTERLSSATGRDTTGLSKTELLKLVHGAEDYPASKRYAIGNDLLDAGQIGPAMDSYLHAVGKSASYQMRIEWRLRRFLRNKQKSNSDLVLIIEGLQQLGSIHDIELRVDLITQALQTEALSIDCLIDLAKPVGWVRISEIGNVFLRDANHCSAIQAYEIAAMLCPNNIGLRQQIGVAHFLDGKYTIAENNWHQTHNIRTDERQAFDLENCSRWFLGQTWLLAIGHVAFIDTHLKAIELGWRPEKKPTLLYNKITPPVGMELIKRFSDRIDVRKTFGPLSTAANELVEQCNPSPLTNRSNQPFEALTHEFWYGRDGEGRVRWYAPLGAEVERAWKAEGRAPLLCIDAQEDSSTREKLSKAFGLPHDAWFVCLHMRESGFHAEWAKKHPGTRDVQLESYQKVVDFIVDQGGWVVRMGDKSMTPLAPQDHVVDYAVHPQKSFELDVLLCGLCAYYVGTNSGLSLIPPIFGKRCALTNWSPIGIPNWYQDDFYIPKLVHNVRENRFQTFPEMFASKTGWSQWKRDFSSDTFVLLDNEPDDLVDIVKDVHEAVFDQALLCPEYERLAARFEKISISGGGFAGSRIAPRFIKKYSSLLVD